MLLHIMSLPRYTTRYRPARGQPHLRHLPLSRIRLLGFHDVHFEADGFHVWSVDESGGDGVARALGLAGMAEDLH